MPISSLAPGARVLVRDEEWFVRHCRKVDRGGHAVAVVGVSELVRGRDAIFLTDIDRITELSPESTELATDDSPQYRRTRLHLEALLRRTPPPEGDDRIYLGHRGAIRQAPYQLAPAAKALRQERPRLLIADGVGLGKTIEVGILLTELIERGRGDRILVVALKSILAQFQTELWARFTIPLVRLDSVGIQRVQSRIPSSMNPFHHFNRVIVSIDTLKKNGVYREYLENCRWDAIVIDECQNVADRGGSQRSDLARLLAPTADALILTSATPHDGKPESFASVIDLLDPTAIADRADYNKADIAHLYIRRFKKHIAHEVGDAFRERILEPRHVDASPAEDAVFAALQGLKLHAEGGRRGNGGILFRTLLLKAFLSSPAACAATIAERRKRLAAATADGDAAARAAAAADDSALARLAGLVDRVDDDAFGKYQQLLRSLRDLGHGGRGDGPRVVVFSERIDTLRFLRDRLVRDLKLADGRIDMFFGTLDDQDQMRLLREFGAEDSRLRILLASDAASEGLNLHYRCHRLVHFDLPWSLITLEQRNGRIDRYGQAEGPVLTYLMTRPSDPALRGDLRVLDLLVEKERVAHESLGDAAWLLRLHDAGREEEHIARGIESGAAAEDVLPDPTGADDLLALLLPEDGDAPPPAETTQDPSLFADDLAYVHEALAFLGTRRDDLIVERLDHVQGIVLHPPEDLRHRLELLPPELLQQTAGRAAVLKLTADRERVMQSLDAARRTEGEWPEWQLLWEQHPVCEWLDDAVLAAFDRHEAPVMRVPHGVAPGTAVFLVQGQMTNERGQPVLVEWFGVPVDAAGAHAVVPLRELVAATRLDRPLANPGRALDDATRAQLKSRLPLAIARATERLAEVRLRRAERLAPTLRASQQRVEDWCRRRLQAIERRRAEAGAGGRGLPQSTRDRLEREQRHAEATRAERRQWLIDGVATNPNPYLRIAAVLLPA